MTTALRNTITALATSFAEQIVHAIRSASLEEILSETGRAAPGRGRKADGGAAASAPSAGAAAARPTGRRRGRLPRRSADDINGVVDQIIGLLKKQPNGLRAEQIRAELGLDKKEMPRPLAEGLSKKKLRKTGQKRSTTYFAR